MSRCHRRNSGFTLVELMVVVVIIGMLASIAMPAFSRYVKKARTAEAPGHLSILWSASISYFEADRRSSTGTQLPHMFPGLSAAQEEECCGQPGDVCPGSSFYYEADDVWQALNFNPPDAHRFRPFYSSMGQDATAAFTAGATGDLDCDTLESRFSFNGRYSTTTGDIVRSGTAILRELE